MNGLEIAKQYYIEFGRPALKENFPDLEQLFAVGLAGSGSECYGFDDEVSRDHDFEPGFCIWIPEEDVIDSKTAFKIERVYSKLPKTYMGLTRTNINPAGGNRHGLIRFSEFLERHIGRKDCNFTIDNWFNIPECALSEVVNGQVWRDDTGVFTGIRHNIESMPDDVVFKKLAGSLYIMGQSGLYNYCRCIKHGEKGAAQLSLAEYVKHTIHVVFLLNRQYMPYYKWSFRSLRNLRNFSGFSEMLELLLDMGNELHDIDKKIMLIEKCNNIIIDAIEEQDLVNMVDRDLGNIAFKINDRITDGYIKNSDILAGVGTLF